MKSKALAFQTGTQTWHDRDMEMRWVPDFLGSDFVSLTIDLPDDAEGDVVTTLVRPTDLPAHPTFIFLAIHGWNDYFYQTELARTITEAGGAFFAVDLRKYGRSLRPWHTFGYIQNLSDYDEEIHACLDAIYTEISHDVPLVLYGHSTGGLTASLWADRHPGTLAALVLNSPWLEYQSVYTRQAGSPVVDLLARTSPTMVLPSGSDDFYQRCITAWKEDPTLPAVPGHEDSDDPFWTSGWNPDPAFRTGTGAPVRTAWLSAILRGHARVAEGLNISCPVLTLTSARSILPSEWSEELRGVDCVLDVSQIWSRVPSLGSHTTLVKLENAVHDVILSRREVRTRAFDEIRRFIRAHLESY